MIKLVKTIREDLVLIVGETAVDLFDCFNVTELHGTNLNDCIKRIEQGGTYIDGMCNEFPNQSDNYYIFINASSLKDSILANFGLIFHESTHYYFRKFWDALQENEEQLITESERLAIEISKIILINRNHDK